MGGFNNNDHNMAELKYSSETFKAYIKWPDSNFYVGKQTVSYKIYLAWKKKIGKLYKYVAAQPLPSEILAGYHLQLQIRNPRKSNPI